MFSNTSIRVRLIAILVAIGFLSIVAWAVEYSSRETVGENFDDLRVNTAPALTTLYELESVTWRMVAEATVYSLLKTELQDAQENPSGELSETIDDEETAFLDTLVTFNDTVDRFAAISSEEEDEVAIADQIRETGMQLHDAGMTLIALKEAGQEGEAVLQQVELIEDLEGELTAMIFNAIHVEQGELDEANEQVNESTSQAQTLSLIVLGITLIILMGVAWSVIRTIIAPILNIKNAAVAISGGNLAQRVDVGSQDELGILGAAFNEMASTVQNREQELRRLNTTLEDRIVEVQEAHDEAERANQVKSAFLASMSHELRTPLNAVINFTKFVAQGDLGEVNSDQEETLNEVISSARHLLNLINDVLDMSKIETGTLNLFVEDNVDLNGLIKTAMSTGGTYLNDKPVELQQTVEADLPVIRGDRQRILQIMLNLISNACKFTQQGHVRLEAKRDGENILISVADTGPGIKLEDQPLVFEAFRQTDTGLRQAGGTGLGLPISKNLAESHGGRIWLESEIGKGSTFYVSLPILSETLTPIGLTSELAK